MRLNPLAADNAAIAPILALGEHLRHTESDQKGELFLGATAQLLEQVGSTATMNSLDGELFVDDVLRMRKYVRQVDPSVRLMMWNDALGAEI